MEPEPLDTAGAIRFAALYGEVDDTFIAVNGDVLTDVDISCPARRVTGATDAVATLHLTAVDDPSRFGVVVHRRRGSGPRFRREAATR